MPVQPPAQTMEVNLRDNEQGAQPQAESISDESRQPTNDKAEINPKKPDAQKEDDTIIIDKDGNLQQVSEDQPQNGQ